MGKDAIAKKARARTPLAPAEQAFLLACLRASAPLPPVLPDLRWDALLPRARSDGLAPLLYARWRDAAQHLPDAVFAQLRHDYYQNASANLIRLDELRRIGRRLAAAHIPLLVLKGGALALTVYADPALRFMGDVDVAVPPQHTVTALRLLQEDGYTVHDVVTAEAPVGPALLRAKGWHLRLAKPVWGKQMELEFHWPLRRRVLVAQVAELDVAGMWETARPLDEEHNLWQPAAAQMLLHLCLHTGLQHRFSDLGLRHYVDVDRFLRRVGEGAAEIDAAFTGAFVAAARAARAAHVSYFVLAEAAALLDTPLPSALHAPLAPPAWKKQLFRRTFTAADATNRRRAFYGRRRWWWRLLTLDRMRDVASGAWRTIFPGRRFLAAYFHTEQPLPLAAYTVWYPFHALARAGRRRWQERVRS
jgi:hypothetical protein